MRLGGMKMTYNSVNISKYARFLLESSIRPVAVLDMDGTAIQVNEAFSDQFTLNSVGNIKELLDQNSVEKWDEHSVLAKKTDSISYNGVVTQKSGSKSDVKIKLLYCDLMKKLVALFEVSSSVKRKVGTAYINSFHMFDKLLILIDRNGKVVDVNELSMKFFQLPPHFFIGKNATDLISLFSLPIEKYMQHLATAVDQGRAEALQRYERAEGDIRYYKTTTFYDSKTETFLVRMSDHTKKVAMEKRLAHRDSLSSVGQLAASIAHEIRNPLTTLKGFTQLLKVSAGNDSLRYLNVIDDEINRMETILSEMLILSKPSTEDKTLISLKSILADMVFLITPKAELDGIVVQYEEKNSCNAMIQGNEVRLKQVILNLFKNAVESMISGGKLTIKIIQDVKGQLVVTISDTGIGISSTDFEQIFTPFYTTREEGTGLGLPFVMKTVQDHGGTINVESELGKGTKFVLTFPTDMTNSEDVETPNEVHVVKVMAKIC